VNYTFANRLRDSMTLDQPGSSPWRVDYDHDDAQRLTAISSPALNSHDYGYNAGNQRTQQVFTAGNYVNYAYDAIGQLTAANGVEPSGTTNRLHEQLGYAYDAAGNLAYRTNNALVQTFGVNALNALTTVSRSGTLTVAGTTSSAATNVTVWGTGLSFGHGRLGTRTRPGRGPGRRPPTDITPTTPPPGTATGGWIPVPVTVYLPASNSFAYDLNGNLLSDGKRGLITTTRIS
jgi:YD repeat-containing protein